MNFSRFYHFRKEQLPLSINQTFVGSSLNSLETTSFMEGPLTGPLLEWSQPKNWSVTQQRRNCVRSTLRTRKGVWYATTLFQQLQKKMRQMQKQKQIICSLDIQIKCAYIGFFLGTMVIIKIESHPCHLAISGFKKMSFFKSTNFPFSF